LAKLLVSDSQVKRTKQVKSVMKFATAALVKGSTKESIRRTIPHHKQVKSINLPETGIGGTVSTNTAPSSNIQKSLRQLLTTSKAFRGA